MRRVLAKQAAFLERLHHERDGALLEVADAAVHELRRTAGRALSEVVLLDEQHLVAARGRVDGDAHAHRAAADDDHVPGLAPLDGAAEHFGAIHRARLVPVRHDASSLWRVRAPASSARAARGPVLAGIVGSKRRSARHWLAISSPLFQNPTASPAR